MHGANYTKYGSMMKSLVAQYSRKTDQYPKNMTDAVDIMSKHPFDQAYYECTKKAHEKNKRTKTERSTEPSQTTTLQLAQSDDYPCHICGSKEHPKKGCPFTGKPRMEWFVTKVMNKMVMNQKGDNETDDDNKLKCCKSVQRNQESDSDDDETDGWCTFETIVSDDDKEGHDVKSSRTLSQCIINFY